MLLLLPLCRLKQITVLVSGKPRAQIQAGIRLKPIRLITTGQHLFYSECSGNKSSNCSDRTLLIHGNESETTHLLVASILVASEANFQIVRNRILVKRP